ncbi:unnamed protein product [Prunus brigantina]
MPISPSLCIQLCILLFWWKLMNKGDVVSHYVDDLEGHDRIKSVLAHIGIHAFLKILAPGGQLYSCRHASCGNILVRVAQSNSSRKSLQIRQNSVAKFSVDISICQISNVK